MSKYLFSRTPFILLHPMILWAVFQSEKYQDKIYNSNILLFKKFSFLSKKSNISRQVAA